MALQVPFIYRRNASLIVCDESEKLLAENVGAMTKSKIPNQNGLGRFWLTKIFSSNSSRKNFLQNKYFVTLKLLINFFSPGR
ncbi:hypothetical protein [Polaromonas sp. CG_9.11]|uniref:hypothetical protein n=1 Tax=Polaromonas sp. CG_9.11 TaxID=2787730 RepID=UPI0018CAD1FD|nr:hypothetical protein [Polaromonas sp. CG_9.11]MBG6076659.1 hypothetical protein [Polaromonas sp. CG_9.11]